MSLSIANINAQTIQDWKNEARRALKEDSLFFENCNLPYMMKVVKLMLTIILNYAGGNQI